LIRFFIRLINQNFGVGRAGQRWLLSPIHLDKTRAHLL
jgi:hypothetical protein